MTNPAADEKMSAKGFNPNMQKATFAAADCQQEHYGRIAKRVANLDGVVGTLVTFHAGSSATTREAGAALIPRRARRAPRAPPRARTAAPW